LKRIEKENFFYLGLKVRSKFNLKIEFFKLKVFGLLNQKKIFFNNFLKQMKGKT